jgi:GNAT superfamily N-acetyltransferase
MRYFYTADVGRIVDVKVDEEFRRMGIATRLKNLELDHMQDNGVEVVYTDVISEGGYRLAKKTGFKPIYKADHIDFQESSLTFSDDSKTGVMFKYL